MIIEHITTCTNNFTHSRIHDQYSWIQCITSGETSTQSLTVSQDSPESIPTLIPPRVSIYKHYTFLHSRKLGCIHYILFENRLAIYYSQLQYTSTQKSVTTTHFRASDMPVNKSRNSRLSILRGASRSSYNSKDPPELGSRRVPDSREAPLSFSAYLEHFHTKALLDYLCEREALKDGLSEVRAAHEHVLTMNLAVRSGAGGYTPPVSSQCVTSRS